MSDFLYAIGSELVNELRPVLPPHFYAEFRQADPTLSASWKYNRVWVMSSRPVMPGLDSNHPCTFHSDGTFRDVQIEITLTAERIEVTCYPDVQTTYFEYAHPGCIEAIIRLVAATCGGG